MVRRTVSRFLGDPWGYRLFCAALFLPPFLAVVWLANHSFDIFGTTGGFVAVGVMLVSLFVFAYRLSLREGFTHAAIMSDVRHALMSVLRTPLYAGGLLLLAAIFAFQPLYKLNPELGDKIFPNLGLLGFVVVVVLTIRRNLRLRRASRIRR